MENKETQYIDKRFDDHESRIRKLEESDVRQQIQLANIEKSQSDIKLMINEGNAKLLHALIESNQVQNNIRISDNETQNSLKKLNSKEVWAIISLIVGALLTYFGLK